jgi:hypothetical protein
MEQLQSTKPTSGIHERRHAKSRLIKNMKTVPHKKMGKVSPARDRIRIFSGDI